MGIGAAIIGASVIGAGATIFGASQAAKAQTQAANTATNAQLQMFGIARQGMQPYIDAGVPAANLIKQFTNDPYFTQPVTMSEQDLENTPGYQFQLYQGQKAVQNGYAARGLGSSGAALKGAASYVQGLAANTYAQQYAIAQDQRNQLVNRFYNLASLGANTAANQGNQAIQTGSNVGSNIIGAGNANAAFYNTAGQSIAGAANNLASYALMSKYLGGVPGAADPAYGGAAVLAGA